MPEQITGHRLAVVARSADVIGRGVEGASGSGNRRGRAQRFDLFARALIVGVQGWPLRGKVRFGRICRPTIDDQSTSRSAVGEPATASSRQLMATDRSRPLRRYASRYALSGFPIGIRPRSDQAKIGRIGTVRPTWSCSLVIEL
jgi:hypothetical protein